MDSNDNERNKYLSSRASSTRRQDSNTVSFSDKDSVSGLSNKAFTSGMIAAASRPITQQGMTGLRPTQTSSGLNRHYHDKRYYLSAIQSHMLFILDEINNLKKQLTENKLDATNYEECKRQVEVYKKQLADLEETLIMYNTAIEISMFKGSKSDVDTDTEKLRKANQQKISMLELLYSDKLTREEQLSKLHQQIVAEDQLFDDIIVKLPEEQQQEYHQLWAKSEQYKKDEEYYRNEINQLYNVINTHEQHVVQNEAKRVRYNLMIKIQELTRRHEKIIEENKIKRTPSQEREYLLEKVKQDRLDMESFHVQEEEYKGEIEKLRERLVELEDELSEKNSARLNKYRELLKRQETMETFLSSYDGLYEEQVNKLHILRSNIIFSLEYISGNSADMDLDDMEKNKSYEVKQNATMEELKQDYKKLMSQLNMINSIADRFQNDIATLKEQQETYSDELKVFSNIDMARDDLIDRQQNLQAQRDSLKKVLQATKSAVAEVEKRQSELDTELKFNDAYKELNKLEDKLIRMKEDNEKHRSSIDNIKMMDNYEKFKLETMARVKDILSDLEKKTAFK